MCVIRRGREREGGGGGGACIDLLHKFTLGSL